MSQTSTNTYLPSTPTAEQLALSKRKMIQVRYRQRKRANIKVNKVEPLSALLANIETCHLNITAIQTYDEVMEHYPTDA
jgi:hypothetical protein